MDKIIAEGVSKLQRDLLTYPKENMKKRSKRMIKNLLGHNESAPDRFFWPHAMMADALWEYYKTSGDESILHLLEKYYDSHQPSVQNIKYPDTVMNGYTLIDIYEKTGKQQYKEMLDSMAEYLKNAPKAQDGSILYRINQKEMVYADTIGMIVPFMCRYGAMVGDKELQKKAVQQVQNFIEHGIDNGSGLPYHAYNAADDVKHGIIGWGRAVGWIMMGIANGVSYLEGELKEQMIEAFKRLLPSVMKYQREDGFYSWQLQAIDGPIDISATGMMLISIEMLLNQKLIDLKYQEVVDEGYKAIIDNNGAWDKCLAECEALSCYPQVYGEYPWGTASTVKFYWVCNGGGFLR